MEQFRGLLKASPDAVLVVDEEGVVCHANRNVEDVLGYAPEGIRGKPVERLLPVKDRDRHVEHRETYLESPEPRPMGEELELYARRADGTEIPVEVSLGPVETNGEQYVVAVVVDVSERRERKRELRREKRQFEAVFDNPVSFMAILAPDGTVRRINEPAREFGGIEPGDVVGEPFPETPWWNHCEQLQSDLREWIGRAAAGEFVRYEADHVGPGGEEITIDGTLYPVTDDGEVTALVAAGRDITGIKERKRALEAKNERLDEFASVVSHDLRNPLNVATGRLELAREECDSPHLEDVTYALERMESLVDDLLVLARQGESLDSLEAVDLEELLEECWAIVETTAVCLEVETDRTILADRGRLAQVFENLFRNAVEHASTDSETTIRVGSLPDGFFLEDDGEGIPPEERERVFEAGYSTDEDGTGLGLRIVAEIVDAHGWEVSIGKSKDGGARFAFTGVEFAEQ
ncbi:PAS domain-containing sensor histidine kinase [Natrialbaceae archaeon A-gly3]